MEEHTETSVRSPFLGLGVLLSVFSLAVLFSGNGSFAYNAGRVAGGLAGSAALALPVFLVWRFVLRMGRRQSLGIAFNVFIALTALLYFVLYIVVQNVAPGFVSQRIGAQPPATANSLIDLDQKKLASNGWTEESTGIKDVGPWLEYAPTGTRFYRDELGIIHQVYPPGIYPNARPANPDGVRRSVNLSETGGRIP